MKNKIVELIELIREQFEVERKKKEIEKKFIETFGMIPETVNVNSAELNLKDNELPDEIYNKISSLLNDLGISYDYFDLLLTVYRTEYENDKDWESDIIGTNVVLTKTENGIKYKLQITPIWEDRI